MKKKKIRYFTAFWGIGASSTYIIGGICLLIPTFQLQFLKLSKLD